MSNESIERTLGSLGAKMDLLLESIREHREDVSKKMQDYEGRMRILESKQSSVGWTWVKDHISR